MRERDFAVIGLGRFGTSICQTLRELGHDVLGIDRDMKSVQTIRPYVTDAVQLDATDEEALRSVGITDYNAVVVAIGVDLESSILVTLLLKEMGVKRVLAKAGNAMQQRVLSKVGADLVVFPEDEGGYRLAHSLVYPAINDFIDLGEDFLILEVAAKQVWVGRSLAELGMAGNARKEAGSDYQGLQVLIIRRGSKLICGPTPEERLEDDDVLAVVGKHKDLEVLAR
jgi:trk system potassium uptake protein TrkA